MDWLFLPSLLLLLVSASWQDIRRRQIPNAIPSSIAALWAVHALSAADPTLALAAIGVASAVLAAGFAVWRLGLMGGGDVKLTAALSLWSGTEHTLSMLLVIALSGGALAVAMIAARHPAFMMLPCHRWLAGGATRAFHTLRGPLQHDAGCPETSLPSPTLPYGVAVAVGGCWLVHHLLVL
ncbi:A24 family peptidase [Benzoatithermus flavus]|uniref:Prepilin peptidase n=1 Tax=Benzoatithermus flavus TaxID=3108223 RepID=A0ABU8XY55_9PROT